jgi:CubicO group peptidase (beta-lactamase class C family)
MVKHALKTILLLGIACCVMNPPLPARVQERDDKAVQVDALFKEYDRPDSPGAAVGAVQNGKTVLQAEYGSANLE